MNTRPVPAPRPMRSFQPCSTLLEVSHHDQRGDHEERRSPPRGHHLGPRARVGLDEPEIDVVHEVRRAPVEVGADRAHVRRGEGREQQALEAATAGCPPSPGRSPPRGSRGPDSGSAPTNPTRIQGHGPQRVVRDGEPERGEQAVALVLGRREFAGPRTRRRPAPGPGYQAAHHCTPSQTTRVVIGSHGASSGGITPKAASVEPKCAAALAVSGPEPAYRLDREHRQQDRRRPWRR